MKQELWYRTPARVWEEALPVGNGRLGAMVFGGVREERLALNEDSLWSGYPKNKNNPEASACLEQVRKLVAAGRIGEAEEIANRHLLGEWTEGYLPLGDLLLTMPEVGEADTYRRSLDIRTGVQITRFTAEGVTYTRTVFASFPAQALIVRLEADHPGCVSVEASLRCPLRNCIYVQDGALHLDGDCPREARPSYYDCAEPVLYDPPEISRTVRFAAALCVNAEGGTVIAEGQRLCVQKADAVTFRFCAGTSFNGFGKMPDGDEKARLARALAVSEGRYRQLYFAHITDVSSLFDRVELDLGHNTALEELPTVERLRAVQEGADDPGLYVLLFQYGRYLLISSSRPGSAPANLQGIWNPHMRAPWSSNYTININTQMNYWLAETCALPECVEPFVEWMQALAVRGEETAKIHYGAKGWVAHHNSDIWAHTAPVGDPERKVYSMTYAPWPLGGAWLCGTLWEHYRFGGSLSYLREKAYPVMAGAAAFFLDFLVENSAGELVTMYSISPENRYQKDGKCYALDQSPTMDTAIIRELFENCLSAQKALGITDTLTKPLRNALDKLPRFRTGEDGRLLEWYESREEAEPEHRHLSHLYGLYPGALITPEDTPELAEACRKSLLGRGFDGTGWSLAWKICLWARLGVGENCLRLIRRQLIPIETTETSFGGGSYPNLLDAHPPFQIDGNFGAAAGIAEMLVQSHRGTPKPLPALPASWTDGHLRGLRLRDGLMAEITWRGGCLVNWEITSVER